jgi:hypothetical protein
MLHAHARLKADMQSFVKDLRQETKLMCDMNRTFQRGCQVVRMHNDNGWSLKEREMHDKPPAFHCQAKRDRSLSGASANRLDLPKPNPNVGKFWKPLSDPLSNSFFAWTLNPRSCSVNFVLRMVHRYIDHLMQRKYLGQWLNPAIQVHEYCAKQLV